MVISSASVPEAAPAAPAEDESKLVDLLWTTKAVVAVSSRVDNATDIPEHLVDRNPATAWNGKTGDLVGAWIAFRVPTDSSVSHLMMSSGFDKTSTKEDLFTANHRVAKVRIFRDGKAIKDATLDTSKREQQRIDLHVWGGEFKIEVLEVVPGTKTIWREITISELAVFGTPGATKPKPGPPFVRVGSLDVRVVPPYDDIVGASYEAACKAWIKEDKETAAESAKMIGRPGEGDSATCDPPSTVTTATHGTIVETAHVSVQDEAKAVSWENFHGELLSLRTASDVKLTNVRVSGHGMEWYSSFDYKLIAEKWVGDQLVIDVERTCGCGSDGYFPPGTSSTWEETMILHTVCDASSATCTTTETKK